MTGASRGGPLPAPWLRELGHVLPDAERGLAVSIHDNFDERLPPGVTRERLARDLAQGARIQRRSTDRGERYVLSGPELQLVVVARLGQSTHRPLTVALHVSRRVDLGATGPGEPLVVTFHDIRDEVAADVAVLERAERAWHVAQKRGRKELEPPESTAERLRRHTRMHHLLLKLQRVRFELAPRVPVDAEVVADPSAGPGTLAVDVADGKIREGDRVKLADAGTDTRCRVEWAEEGRAHLRMPPGPLPPAGNRVTLTVEERFPLDAQEKALRRLRQLEVVGSAEQLASLLLDPPSLLPPRSDALPSYHHDRDGPRPLDARQRQAVARAVTAPAAAFVHGPPGTGKSTVIVEVIRQLVGWGERVLFTSPSHVAVDEVLRRLRGVPGVRPLRLSWAEALVREEVRCFTPSSLTAAAAREVMEHHPDGIEVRRRALRARIGALQRARHALPAREEALAVRAAAIERREAAARAYALRHRAWLAREIVHVEFDRARIELDRTIAAEREAEARLRDLGVPDGIDSLEALDDALQGTRRDLDRLDTLEATADEWRASLAALGARAEPALVVELKDLPPRATNVVACTITGLAGSPEARDAEFDTLIVDEASRVTEGQFLIGAVRARRWLLVGDEHQLPPYVEPADEQALHALIALRSVKRGQAPTIADAVDRLAMLWEEEQELRRFRVDAVRAEAEAIEARGEWPRYAEAFGEHEDDDRALLRALRDLLVRSFFERAVGALQGPAEACATRLEVQRRMVPEIARLVAGPVYDGAYRSPSTSDVPVPLPVLPAPVLWIDSSKAGARAMEQQEGNGFVNPWECARILELLRNVDAELGSRGHPEVTTSVLCFYSAQARLIRRELARSRSPACLRIELVDAIDKIQGQESDLVVLSFCRARLGRRGPGFAQWLRDYRRLNVACTRAHRNLVLVGHGDTLLQLRDSEGRAGRFYTNLFACAEASEPWIATELDSRPQRTRT